MRQISSIALVGILFITGCATTSSSNQHTNRTTGQMTIQSTVAVSEETKDAMTFLVLGPKPNPVKNCTISALELNLGLTMKLLGKATDEEVKNDLLTGITNPDVLKLREAQAQEWVASRKPSQLAKMNFDFCLRPSDISHQLGDLVDTCFSMTSLPARIEAQKYLGVSREEAIIENQRVYTSPQPAGHVNLPAEYVKYVVEGVYDNQAKASDFLVHRRVFVDCVRSAKVAP